MNFESTLTFGRSNLCSWSPNGRFLAVLSAKSRLVLRDAASLDVVRTEVIVSGGRDDKVDLISFSPDSQFILASDLKNAVTFVFKVGNDKVMIIRHVILYLYVYHYLHSSSRLILYFFSTCLPLANIVQAFSVFMAEFILYLPIFLFL